MRSPTAPSRGRGAGQKGGGGAGTLSLDVRPLCSSSTCSACASVPNTIPSSGPRGGYWQPPGQYSRAAGGGDSEQSKEAGEEEKGGAVEPRCVSPGPNCLGIEQTAVPPGPAHHARHPGSGGAHPGRGRSPARGRGRVRPRGPLARPSRYVRTQAAAAPPAPWLTQSARRLTGRSRFPHGPEEKRKTQDFFRI